MKISINVVLLILCFHLTVKAQQQHPITWNDVSQWRYIKSFTGLSPDGYRMAYVSGPVEGDQGLIIRSPDDTAAYRYTCGADTAPFFFSDDSK